MRQSNKKLRSLVASCTVMTAMVYTTYPTQAVAENGDILAHIMPTDHIFHQASERFMSKLDELSNGEMNIAYHPGGDLGDWGTITDQVMQGSIPMTMTWASSELDLRLDVANLGYVADNWEEARELYSPGSYMNSLYKEIYGDLNMVLLGTMPTDFTGFVVRKGLDAPVNVPEDAQGFKMRVPNYPMAIDHYRDLGFSVVPMDFSEVYTALQTGGIDGRAYSPPSEVLLFKDVLESYVFTRESFETTFFLANKQWFESLSEEQQAWVQKAAKGATEWAWDAAESQSAGWLEKIRESGVDVVELTPAQLEDYKEIVIASDWPHMEHILGPETMNKIKEAAGL